MKMIKIKDDFNEYPGLRNCSISDFSGELFYHTVLNERFAEAFEKREALTVDLDDTGGYASSFLDEAFGNLVYDFTLKEVKKLIRIISVEEPHWKLMIEDETFKQWENRRIKNEIPKVTVQHNEWYRLLNGQMVKNIWEQPPI